MKEQRPSSYSSEFIDKLYEEYNMPRKFVSVFCFDKSMSPTAPYDVMTALEIEKDLLSLSAQNALAAIEETANSTDSLWNSFKWKLSAFMDIQDIFDAPLHPSSADLRVIFEQYYFYYESRIMLAEAFIAGLNGLNIAADVLLRPFLEFSLLQNYYYRICNIQNSYQTVEAYFLHGKHPSWNTILRKALPDDSFCKPIRFRIKSHMEGLSETAIHPYLPDYSPLQYKHSEHGYSIESLYFWIKMRYALDAALWVYFVNFPLLFQPVNILSKFGYNAPVGIFIDRHCAEVMKRSIPDIDYQAFSAYSSTQESIRPKVEWANSLPDLSEEQIKATWNEKENGPYKNQIENYCLQMSKQRGIKKALAHKIIQQKDVPDRLINEIENLEGWKKICKRRA